MFKVLKTHILKHDASSLPKCAYTSHILLFFAIQFPPRFCALGYLFIPIPDHITETMEVYVIR